MPSIDSSSSQISRLASSPQSFPVLVVRNGSAPTVRTPPAVSKSSSDSSPPSVPPRSPPSLQTVLPPNGELHQEPTAITTEVDLQIIEALKSKDRIYVLKVGEIFESLINERRTRVELTPSTSYQRMLVYRCSDYYCVAPESEGGTKPIFVSRTPESKIPSRRICELVPAELSLQPAFQIMRRSNQDRRSKTQSQSGSNAGEEADLSDVEPSESGSLGGRSNATGSSTKKRMTIEEREAAYNEARSRIFMGFEEKEKEKDMSASSSTHSLLSAGGGGGSSVGDVDDPVSTTSTESDWFTHASREKREPRRGGSGNNGSGSSRSLRSSAPPFNVNGSGSSRNSRSSSPAFQYPSLYEPAPTATAYDMSQSSQPPGQGYVAPWMYQPPPPVQGQSTPPNYIPSYPYYPPYPWPISQAGSVLPSSESSPAGGEMFLPPHHAPPPAHSFNPYLWPNMHQPAPVHGQPPPHPRQQQQAHHTPPPPPPQNSHYPVPYIAPYPYPPYYPPQPPPANAQMTPPPGSMSGLPYACNESPAPPPANGHMTNDIRNNHNNHGTHQNRASSRNSTGSSATANGMKRGGGAPPTRTAWSYGPGVGMGGVAHQTSSFMSGETVGPRLSSALRRTSGASSMGSSVGNRAPAGDEASSTASSSTTSSSSRRTYTSTSSQHPLPARPDWAVGLKPAPSSKHTRNVNSNHTSRTMSPARNHNNQTTSSPALQSADFPPLTSLSAGASPRPPAVAGAWTNAHSMRSVMMPSAHAQGTTALVHHHPSAGSHLEDPDHGFERPPPKGAVELFNPKAAPAVAAAARRTGSSGSGKGSPRPDRLERERERSRADGGGVTGPLALRVGALALEEGEQQQQQHVNAGASELPPSASVLVPT